MIILNLLIILYVAIGFYLLKRDEAHPDFEEMLETARKKSGMSKEDLDSVMFWAKVMSVLTWPIMFKDIYVAYKEAERKEEKD